MTTSPLWGKSWEKVGESASLEVGKSGEKSGKVGEFPTHPDFHVFPNFPPLSLTFPHSRFAPDLPSGGKWGKVGGSWEKLGKVGETSGGIPTQELGK